MQQKISGFHKDEANHWVAELECGHGQHLRHDPPWQERPWIEQTEARLERIGTSLNCKRCDEVGAKVAAAVLRELRRTLNENYEAGGVSGLCAEGRWDLALDALNSLDLQAIAERALREPNSK